MLPLAFDDWLESFLGYIMRSKLSDSLSFISSFILHRLSVSLSWFSHGLFHFCPTFCLSVSDVYDWACVCSCALRVCFLIDIRKAHRKGSDACTTTPLPFCTVTFSFVLSCLIPCFLNCLFFPPFLHHSFPLHSFSQDPRNDSKSQGTGNDYTDSLNFDPIRIEYQQDSLALFNYSSQAFFLKL